LCFGIIFSAVSSENSGEFRKSINQNYQLLMGSSAQQFFQRFILFYLVLYIVPYGFEYIEALDINPSTPSFWTAPTVWFGETFLGWEFNLKRLMKGFDSKYDFARFLLIATLSVLGALIWGVLASKFKRIKNIRVKTWVITIIRYHVGLTLILYGIAKVLVLQFGEIDLLTLENKLGTFNGMSFLWKFMSYSPFYAQVTGYIEVIAGVLLLFRGTTFLGGVISLIAMINVVFMDIGYDVTVKMFAIHLLLMVMILVGYNAKRLIQFLVFNQTTVAPVKYESLFPDKYKLVRYGLKIGIVAYFSITQFNFQSKRLDQKSAKNEAPSMTSVYFVKNQTINGKDIVDAEVSESVKWETIFINGSSYLKNSLVIQNAQGRRRYFSTETDTVNKTIVFYPLRGKKEDSNTFIYEKLDDKKVRFEGIYQGDTISVMTESKAMEDYIMIKSKRKWIRDLG